MKPSSSAAVVSKGNAASIRRLMDFCRLGARLEGNKPSFSKFLGLSAAENDDETPTGLCPDRLSFSSTSSSSNDQQQQQQQQQPSSQSLVLRYAFPDRCKHLQQHDGAVRLSTYTSLLDDATTLALVAAAKTNPRPGVSVTMQCQWAGTIRQSPQEVDICTTITKRGRTLGFVRADVRDPSGRLICSFDHVKYLPINSWVLGWMLSPVGMWCLDLFSKYLAPYFLKSKSNNKPPQDYSKIMDSYQQTSDTTATFAFGPQHSNGMGGLHGGVQAILMERLGKTVAQHELESNNVECERLSVSYQSSASKELELRAHVMDPPTPDRPFVTLRIEILRKPRKNNNSSDNSKPPKKVVVVSEGILTFGIASSKKDQ